MKKTKFFGALLAFAALSGTMTSCKVEADTDDSGNSGKDVAYQEEMQGVSVTGFEKDYTYVDLGLSSGLKWSTYNLGADYPEQVGDYYAWGATSTNTIYAWSSYKYCTDSNSMTKYYSSDKLSTLSAVDDAAAVNWGGKWRMPTNSEAKELIDGCTWEWTDDFNGTGASGVIGTSKANGNTIFFVAGGYNDYSSPEKINSYLAYWTSTLSQYDDSGLTFYYSSSKFSVGGGSYRFTGHTVRAVMD